MTESIGTARLDIVVDTSQFDAAITSAKRSVSGMSTAAQAEYNKLGAAEKRRVDSLIKQADTLGYTREQQILYNASLKGVPTAVLDELKRKLTGTAQATAALANSTGASSKAFSGTAKSARELQFATRGLPAQFTDIAVSLASGQRPLMVLLQQGGQLKDMFGGIGPAFRSMGAYVAGMVNPITLAAAAFGTLAIAWHQGSEESTAFNKALILTGNYAGTTAEQMAKLALQMDGIAGVTTASASEALAAVAATGKFTGDQLEQVGTAAEQMRAATGKALSETIAEFEKLRGDPVKAILELNDQYHFLTQTQLDNIVTLKEQGRETDAVAEAFRIYADTIADRAPQVTENLGSIERSWKSIKGLAAETWDSLLSIGRASSLAELERDLAIQEVNYGRNNSRAKQLRAEIESMRAEAARAIPKPGATVDSKAALKAITEKKKAEDEFGRLVESNYTKQQKLATEIAKIEETGRVAGKSAGEVAVQVAAARARYAESEAKSKKKARAAPTDPAIAILSRIKQQIALNAEELKSVEALTASERLRITIQNELENSGKKVTAARRAEIEATLLELDASGKATASFKTEAKAKEELARLTNQLASAEANRRAANEADLATIGKGREQVDQMRRRLDIEREYTDGLRELRDSGVAETDASYIAQELALRESRDRSLGIEAEYQAKRKALMADASNGANAAMEDYVANAEDLAGQAYDFYSKTFGGLEDAMVSAATGGKDAFGKMLDDMYADAVRFLAQQAVKALLKSFNNTGNNGSNLPGQDETSGGGGGFDWAGLATSVMGMFGGGRADGGPVQAGKFYEVGENNRPELLSFSGKQYLIPGNDGNVTPIRGGGESRSVVQNFTQVVQGQMTRKTSEQSARLNGREAARGMARTGR